MNPSSEVNNINVNEVWYGLSNDDWDYKKIKYVFDERKETNNPIKTEELISLTMEDGVVPHSMKTGSGGNKPKEDLSKYKVVHPGDMVINPMNVIVGSVGLSKYYGVLSPVYITLTLKEGGGKVEFYDYLFSTELFQKSLMGMGNGILIKESESSGKLNTIRMRIPMSKLGNHFLPIPPIKEQPQIVSYLDQKTQKIDELVTKFEKKIELHKEQRISLINEVVTKGLNPNIEMKDSGVEWIGEIPSHWEIKKIKYMGFIKLSSVDRKENVDERRVNICHYPDVYNNEKVNNETKFPLGSCTEDEFKNFSLVKNDILITKDSESPDDIGIPTFVDDHLENTVCGYHISQIRITNTENVPEFVFRYIESTTVKDYFFISSNGITRYGLGKPSIESLYVTCPPKDEQESIVEFLDEQTQLIDKTITKEEKRITLFKEYKQSLISEVVTGKTRVTEDMV